MTLKNENLECSVYTWKLRIRYSNGESQEVRNLRLVRGWSEGLIFAVFQ